MPINTKFGPQDPRVGHQISSLGQIYLYAQQRRSLCRVMGANLNIMPAAVALNWSGITIHNAIMRGLYLYSKPEKQPRYVRPTTPEN